MREFLFTLRPDENAARRNGHRWLWILLLVLGIGLAPLAGAAVPDGSAAALRAALRLTELMYDPPQGDQYEFIELQNTSAATTLDLGGLTFTSGIAYTIPAGTTLAPGAYLLLTRATSLSIFRAFYNVPAAVTVLTPYSGKLDNKGEQLTLKTAGGIDTLISFTYDNARGWPLPPQGGGHSLAPAATALAGEPDGSLEYCGNWRSSVYMKGSPGKAEPAIPAGPVINEFDAHTDPPPPAESDDWIELYNPTGTAITLNGNWFLSDDLEDLRKYAFSGATVPAGGFLSLDETVFHPSTLVGFGLNKAGEQIFLSYLPGNGQDRIVDSVRYEGQERGPSIGRYPNGGAWWFALNASRGKSNTTPPGQVVISEAMYHSDDGTTATEYVELYNPTGKTVNLWNVDGDVLPWRVSGEIDYTIPIGTTLAPGEYLVLVSFPPSNATLMNAFKAKYGVTGSVRFMGPYANGMSNKSGRVSLEKAQAGDVPDPPTLLSWIVVDQLIYFDQSPFPPEADGSGKALQRLENGRSGMEPANWLARLPTPGRSASSPPVLAGKAATGVDFTAARLNGQVVSTGAVAPTVTLYWGTRDGGTNAAAWGHSLALGALGVGDFSAPLAGLAVNTTYYYRFCATHSGGTVWSPATQSFKTLLGYALGVTSARGTVIRQPDKPYYLPGEQVTLSATAQAGYRFSHWQIAGLLAWSNPVTVRMDAARQVTAVYYGQSAAGESWKWY